MQNALFRLWLVGFFSGFASLVFAQKSPRILLIPLDDRPPCLQFPVRMGAIGQAQITTPPRLLLGKFTEYGQSDAIVKWLQAQDLQQFEAVIVSFDMLAYGGLVASRVHATPLAQALARVEVVKQLRERAPKLKIYGSSVIMRLAPTADGKNEAYREKLSQWAEHSPYSDERARTAQLEKEIPAEALTDYQQARRRNLTINELTVELVKNKTFDYLILSQDDAKPRGIHVRDREALLEKVKQENLTEKVAVQPGADEVSMLLLARAMSDYHQYHPRVKAVYSSAAVAAQVMPYEDRPLRQTVSFHLKAVGATEVNDIATADIVYFVFATRHTQTSAETFAQQIIDFQKKHPKKGIIVADVDPKGDVQGGDVAFTKALYQAGMFDKLYGYACWNTAGNTIGTALPHGMVYGVAQRLKLNQKVVEAAQRWFVMNRLLDDFMYHSLVRPEMNQKLSEKGWNPYRLTDEQTKVVEVECRQALESHIASWRGLSAAKAKNVSFKAFNQEKLSFQLPWNRTFEAEINF